jgi:hypothetical protein
MYIASTAESDFVMYLHIARRLHSILLPETTVLQLHRQDYTRDCRYYVPV